CWTSRPNLFASIRVICGQENAAVIDRRYSLNPRKPAQAAVKEILLVELYVLEFGEDGADEDLTFDAEDDAVGVVRDPDGGAPEFFVRLELVILADLAQLQVELDRIVAAGTDGNFFAIENGDGGEIGVGGGVDDDLVAALVLERLAAQIKHGREQ